MLEETFKRKRSTTGYWVGKARQAGYLGPTARGKVGIWMGHIRKLGERRYQARRVDPNGRECSKIFTRRTDAEDKITQVEASKLDGSYVDHKNKITVVESARDCAATRPHRSTTAKRVRSLIEGHIASTEPGARKVSAVRPSEVQAWVTERSQTLSPGTVRLLVQTLRSVFNAAVQDRLVARSPVTRLRLPRSQSERITPLSVVDVQALADAMPERCRAWRARSIRRGVKDKRRTRYSLLPASFQRVTACRGAWELIMRRCGTRC
jgi:hypothetical protein